MTIELNHANQGSRTSGHAGVHAKKSGRADDGAGDGATGFMALMMSLSSDGDTSSLVDLNADLPAMQSGLPAQLNVSLDGTIPVQAPMVGVLANSPATNFVETVPSLTDSTLANNLAVVSALSGSSVQEVSTLSLVGRALPDVLVGRAFPDGSMAGQPGSVTLPATTMATLPGSGQILMAGLDQKLVSADNASGGAGTQVSLTMPVEEVPTMNQQGMGDANVKLATVLKEADLATFHTALKVVPKEALVPDQPLLAAVKAPFAPESLVDAVTATRSILHAPSISAAGQDAKAVLPVQTSASAVLLPDVASALATLVPATMSRPPDRFNSKSGYGQSGAAGFDAGFGQAVSSMNRSDAVFVVPPSSAAVADTAVAETVSYWVSHGVQNAEMTLDGFGDSPVKVSILLQGDQAQIDFRTDQVAVRQVLEEASSQLKEMLSGQGLQLAGMSVGTSRQGGSGSGENRPARGGVQRISMAQEESIGMVSARAANLSVGQSLDLFV